MGKGDLYYAVMQFLKEEQETTKTRTNIIKGDNMADRDQFSGDMSRNEVEIDLSKFMEMVTENNELKQKIWELNMTTKLTHGRNTYFLQRPWILGEYGNTFLSVYIFLIYYVVMWFLELEAPTMEQSGLISILVGAGRHGLDYT